MTREKRSVGGAIRRALGFKGWERRIRRAQIVVRDMIAPLPPPEAFLGVLAIMKNETMNLREWLDHYRWQGVDKVFLIDNGSTDQPRRLIKDDIRSGFVEFFDRPMRFSQNQHYGDVFALAAIARKVRWLVMADLDEFWYAPKGDLRSVLRSYDPRVRVIYANWKNFGSSGHDRHPVSVREGFTMRHPVLDQRRKWICRTDTIACPTQLRVHHVHGIPRDWATTDNQSLALNHYIIQSREFYTTVKMTRGDVHRVSHEQMRDLQYFETWDRPATYEDRELADLVNVAAVLDGKSSWLNRPSLVERASAKA